MNPLRGAGQERLELVHDERFDIAGDFLVLKRLADGGHDFRRGHGADVGQVKPFFQLREEVLIDAALEAKQLRHAAKEAARLRQAAFDFGPDFPEHGLAILKKKTGFRSASRPTQGKRVPRAACPPVRTPGKVGPLDTGRQTARGTRFPWITHHTQTRQLRAAHPAGTHRAVGQSGSVAITATGDGQPQLGRPTA